MTTQNSVNLGLSGVTGSGTFVGATSPTLVTPTIGAAVATSIQIGATTCSAITGTGSLVAGSTPTIDSPAVTTILTLTAGQIAFPATQVPSAGANVLDDYEEGTWTPSVGGNASYTTQSGVYTKIGRLVHLQAILTINVIGTGSQLTISGCPFTSSSSQESAGVMAFFSTLASSVVFINPYVAGSAATINFNTLAAAATSATNNPNIMTSSTQMNFAITHQAS